ncbi:hypothetical protein OIV83_001714 [Microbotryomycetes sp. JL201]|nr:hypothetical protein OIV83_001714 [Microbotryomycetes sp. JL201]
MDQENKPPAPTEVSIETSRRVLYAKQSHQPFAKSAAKRQSVMTLPPIAHLQHQYAKMSVKPKLKQTSENDPQSSAPALSEEEETDSLPPSPTKPRTQPRMPWDDGMETRHLELDARVLNKKLGRVLADLRTVWGFSNNQEHSHDLPQKIESTVNAVRVVKQWLVALPSHASSLVSDQDHSELRKTILLVLGSLQNFNVAEHDSEQRLVTEVQQGVDSLVKQIEWATRSFASESRGAEAMASTLGFEPRKVLPRWASTDGPAGADSLGRFSKIADSDGSLNMLSVARARAMIHAFLPEQELGSLDDEAFIKTLSDGTVLCLAFNAIVHASSKRFGFIPEDSIHYFKSDGSKSAYHISADMDRRESSSSSSSESMGENKIGDTFRRTRNLAQWAAAVKIRYLVSMGHFDAKIVGKRSPDCEYEWRAVLTNALELYTSAVVAETRQDFVTSSDQDRIVVGVAGIPGSGKSTLAYPLVNKMNQLLGAETDTIQVDRQEALAHFQDESRHGNAVAVAVGLDGWHCTRARLDQFPDPVEARRRRGAAFTFESRAYVSFIKQLKQKPLLDRIKFQTFSHAKKDPEPAKFDILASHRIVIVEGLYCLLDIDDWKEATDLLTERVWVECDRQVARERLIKRHLDSGVETEYDKAVDRVDRSDLLNGDYITEHLAKPTFTVRSVQDSRLVEDS